MKKHFHTFLVLSLLFFTGCKAPIYVQHSPASEETHQVVSQKEIVVDVPVIIPETNHTGTIEAPTATDLTQTWDWADATTTLEVVNGPTTEHGLDGVVKLGKTTYRVSTKVKAKNYVQPTVITFADTTNLLTVRYAGVDSVFLVTDTTKEFLYTISNDYQPCDNEIPPLPAPGSPWWKWPLWIVAAGALLFGVGRARNNPQSKIRNPKLA